MITKNTLQPPTTEPAPSLPRSTASPPVGMGCVPYCAL